MKHIYKVKGQTNSNHHKKNISAEVKQKSAERIKNSRNSFLLIFGY